jgi:hypothetical protein
VANERDYYAILQVGRAATQQDIDRAYERLAAQYDPATSRKPRAAQRYKEVVAAYEALGDPQRRRQYDRQLSAANRPAGSMMPSDVLSNRFVLICAAIIVASVSAIAALLIVFGGLGGDDDELVVNTGTPTPVGTPTPTPFGQTPRPSPQLSPPPLEAEPLTTESGLQYIIIEEGTGENAAEDDIVIVEYSGWLQETGVLFDSSFNPGQGPIEVTIGAGGVIDGWEEGLQLMKEGTKIRLIIPGDLAYGPEGRGDTIPPNATLIFDMEMLLIVKPGETFTPSPSPAPPSTPGPSGAATPTATATPTPTGALTETPAGT